jgi:multimeric flavodoxin WrbA
MKILVLGGSPKGELSVTMQYVKYMQRHLKEHDFTVIQVAAPIKRLEKNPEDFSAVIKQVKTADAVLWAFPLYYMLVCSQYKRFIELIFERKAESAFYGKYTATLSTSIHFYDHTAHNYLRAVCEDLRLKYTGFFSAKMHDMFSEQGRNKLTKFADLFIKAIQDKIETPRYSLPLPKTKFIYKPERFDHHILQTPKKITIVTDSLQGNIGRMIRRFQDCFSQEIEVVNLKTIDIKGGCLGCLKCSNENICAYSGKDQYIPMFNTSIKKADILILAGEIKDRYLSSTWKMFFDRSFFNTHQPVLKNKQIGILISGPLGHIPNLSEILKAYWEIEGSSIVDFITDESQDSKQIDSLLSGLARRLTTFAETEYIHPATFLGVAGMKVFRDDIWGGLRAVFRADHKYYKKNKLYDFPQKNPLKNLIYRTAYFITGIPFIRKKMVKNMKRFMIMPYQRVLNSPS